MQKKRRSAAYPLKRLVKNISKRISISRKIKLSLSVMEAVKEIIHRKKRRYAAHRQNREVRKININECRRRINTFLYRYGDS